MKKVTKSILSLMLAFIVAFASFSSNVAMAAETSTPTTVIYVGKVAFDADKITSNAAYKKGFQDYLRSHGNDTIIVSSNGIIFDANKYSNAPQGEDPIIFASATVPADAVAVWDGVTALPDTNVVTPVCAVSAVVTNALKGYSDTVLLGSNALLEVTVKDEQGNIIPNKQVVLTLGDQMAIDPSYYLEVKGNIIATTDNRGVATFVVGPKLTAISTQVNRVAAAKYTAEVVGLNKKVDGTVKFAAIGVSDLYVVNQVNDDEADDLVPSTNSVIAPVSLTTNMVAGNVEYVNSQQVSAMGKDNHAVTFDAEPALLIPPAFGTKTADTYTQAINAVSGPIHPYGTWTKSFTVPAGLKYATLNFNRIQMSAYSRLTIRTLNASTYGTIETYTKNGPIDQSNFGYQIPVQPGVSEIVSVTISAPGQVDTAMNGGLDIKDITGVYSNVSGIAPTVIALPGAKITWNKTDLRYSDIKYFTTNNNGNTADVDSLGINVQTLLGTDYKADYTYSYQVPVFPQTGDAVIIGKDPNGVAKQYFVWPTVNNTRNINVLKAIAGGEKAILVTNSEATTSVGSITPNGNGVTVNSELVGYTGLKGVITAPTLGSDVFDATNNTIYTSVQWAPLPSAVAATVNKKEMALVGQRITVKAQLTDANGNPVSVSNQPITWSYAAGDITALGSLGATQATVVSKDAATDANGQATIVLSSGDFNALVSGLKATNTNNSYKVSLKIGNDVITTADLEWIAAGLAFKPTLDTTFGPVYGTADTVTNNAPNPNAGSNWEYAYRLYGKNKDVVDARVAYITVSGVGINYQMAPGSVGSMNVSSTSNLFNASSNVAGILQAVGTIGQISSNVTFTVVYPDYTSAVFTNVGEGTPSLYSNLVLPIAWKAVGQQANFVTPAGTNIAASQTSTTVYVKVTDALGNPLVNKGVSYTITGQGNVAATSTTTNAYGLAPITINKAADVAGQSVVSATVDGLTTAVTTTINWVAAQGPAFGLVNIGLNAAGTNDVLVLTFSEPVNANSIALGQFRVHDAAGVNYAVKDARVADNVVYLTMADSNAKLPTNTVNSTYSVDFSSYVATSGANAGIAYAVTDLYGRTLSYGDDTTSLRLPGAYEVAVTFDGISKLTITAKNGNVNVADGQVVRLVTSDPRLFTILGTNTGIFEVALTNGTATIDLAGGQLCVATVAAYYNGVSSQVFANTSVTTNVSTVMNSVNAAIAAGSGVTTSITGINQITATVATANNATLLKDVLNVNTILAGSVKPSTVQIGANPAIAVSLANAATIQAQIEALVGGGKTINNITLADLKGKSIKAVYNGIEYTLRVAN